MESWAPRDQKRTLTRTDYLQLARLLDQGSGPLPGSKEVQRALHESYVVLSDPVAPGLVTMNAQIFLILPPEEQFTRVTLCYPEEADPARGRISVLSPLGSCLLGLSNGETATWRSFGRTHSARIAAVIRGPQPTARVQA
ncbi:MAG: Transcription elongation factor-like protein [Ramlibacter sp.]|nr:Transcription elongation factor-like protein [Ramlibacter sp.]